MTDFLIRLFLKDAQDPDQPEVRSRCGVLAGVVGIICNVILFAAKLVVGTISHSLSITADAVNNLSDASSSVMTLIGFEIAKRPPDEEHPFGHARMEYLSGLGVAALIVVIGVELAKTSISKILHPVPVEFSLPLVVVLVLSIALKLWMARFNLKLGRRIHSTSLIATAQDSRNDVLSTSAVLLAAAVSYFTHLELDGIIGLLVACFILWSGAGIAKETISPLLGAPADPELVHMISRETRAFDPRILGIHDLLVHDYGPGQRFASVHVELDYHLDPLVAHELLDDLERMFQEKHHIQMVVHHDPLVTDDQELNTLRDLLAEELQQIDPDLSLHDFRMVRGEGHTNLIFDLYVPHKLAGQEEMLRSKLERVLPQDEKTYYLVITFDHQSINQF